MSIISVRDNENNRWNINAKKKKKKKERKKKRKKRTKGTEVIKKGKEMKWFCWVFKPDFLKLILKASLIFKRI